jgi:nucleotidyltransferase AbiEii toxin of type IV toxin-antitoxin system
MPEPTVIDRALAAIAHDVSGAGHGYALVGGLAVSVRAEVRFTRDVDIAVAVADDRGAEALVRSLSALGYKAVATVEDETRNRLSTARLLSPLGVKIDLLFASSGIEEDIVARASPVDLPGVGSIAVARAEELLAMKVLSMSDTRLQDRIDARNLLRDNPDLDLDAVRECLRRIRALGFDRGQDLAGKLTSVLADRVER